MRTSSLLLKFSANRLSADVLGAGRDRLPLGNMEGTAVNVFARPKTEGSCLLLVAGGSVRTARVPGHIYRCAILLGVCSAGLMIRDCLGEASNIVYPLFFLQPHNDVSFTCLLCESFYFPACPGAQRYIDRWMAAGWYCLCLPIPGTFRRQIRQLFP